MPSWSSYIVPAAALLLAAAAATSAKVASYSSCSYKGTIYPHSPHAEVMGDKYTCYCEDGEWVRCRDNELTLEPDDFGMATTALQDRNQFAPSDFVADLLGSPVDSTGAGGTIRPLSVAEFPALRGQGVSLSLFELEPCGINLPHVHPRATEITYVIKGSKLRTSFVEENNGRTIVNDIKKGQVTFFPEGLIHYQQNLGCDTAQYLSALNSEDPGVVTISTRTFTLPSEALQATFALSAGKVAIIKKGIPAGPAQGRKECLKRCGLWTAEPHWEGEHGGNVPEWPAE